MPVRWICFDENNRIEIEKLLAGDEETLRIADKFAPLPYVMALAGERKYRPGISATAGLNGTRYNWLQHCTNYAIDFDSSAYRALGISVHALLEDTDISEIINSGSEQFVAYDNIRGRYDLWYEIDGEKILVDYKVVGSFAIVKALGVIQNGRKPKLDRDGNQEYYQRNGKGYKAGDPKTEPVYTYNINRGENNNYRMQGTIYKILLAKNGIDIDRFRVMFLVRDGGIQMAYSRGVSKRSYYIEFPFLPEDEVIQHYRQRRDELVQVMEYTNMIISGDYTNKEFVTAIKNSDIKIPEPCNAEEAWQGRRCQGYCAFAEVCKQFGNPYISGGKNDEELRDF